MIPTLISAKSIVSLDSIVVAIRDTTADGRAFYNDIIFSKEHGEMFRTTGVGMDIIREINEKRILAESKNVILQLALADCDKEVILADKATEAQKVKFDAMVGKFDNEVIKSENIELVLKDYKKKAFAGKIMTVVGGVGIGVGIAGILYGVIVSQTK